VSLEKDIEKDYPLIVDLDGTLIETDLLHIAIKSLLRRKKIFFFKFIGWIIYGRAYFKSQVFSKVIIDPVSLPYNRQLLKFLYSEYNNGRRIVLATASLKGNALEIAKVHPIFSDVYGTEGKINLKGKNKLEKLISVFEKGKFDYIGNSLSDLIIFSSSRYAYLVGPSKLLENRAKRIGNVKRIWRKESI
jgi:phosphoserine phosphatase